MTVLLKDHVCSLLSGSDCPVLSAQGINSPYLVGKYKGCRRQTHSDKFIKVHKRANKEKLGLNKNLQTQQQHQAIFQKDSVLYGGLILGGHLFFSEPGHQKYVFCVLIHGCYKEVHSDAVSGTPRSILGFLVFPY